MKVKVDGQKINITEDFLVENSVGIYECEFEFDSAWDGFSKTSVWQLNQGTPIETVIDSGVAIIPWEVLVNDGLLRIGVYGTKDEKVMPTVWGEKRRVCLGTPTGSIGTEPTPSIYAQILAVATEAKDIAEEVAEDWENVYAEAETLEPNESATAEFDHNADCFRFGIPQGQQGERGETGAQGEDGFSPIVTVTSIVGGHQITITDAEGAHIFAVMDGVQGEQGETGVGIATITQNADYSLTITLTNGTTYTTTSLRGETGATGATPDFSIGTVTTLEPNESATATITGTAEEPVLNLGIPKGVKGDTGEVSEAELEEALIDKADIILNSASGSIATFDDGANMPVKSLEVEINAVQSGSGDPSPTNIRPISGWDAVNVYVSPTTDAGDGTTYPISLGDTYYGGVLDVTSGVLTVTHEAIVYDGSDDENWKYNNSLPNSVYYSGIPTEYRTEQTVLCSTLKGLISGGGSGLELEQCRLNANNTNLIVRSNIIVSDLTDWTTYLTSNPMTVIYKRATPTTVQLTPTEVSTLLGRNNIFCNSGEVEVLYRADTKRYIDGTIVDVPLAMIAPIESGTTSSKAYAIGEYFILNGNQFCKAKTAIASGATFTLNTNYTVTTIATELKALA